MANINGGAIRQGMIIVYTGKLCKVNSTEHVKPGKGGAFMQVDMHDIKVGTRFNVRFRTEETVEQAYIESKDLYYSYLDGDRFVFMDNSSGEELSLSKHEMRGINTQYLVNAGQIVHGEFCDNKLIDVSWPSKTTIELTVVETEGYLQGSTATQKEKPAVLSNGVRIKVSCHVNVGDIIAVNPATECFMSVIKKSK